MQLLKEMCNVKRYKKVTADIQPALYEGTTFYAATLEQIINAYSNNNKNCWILESFKENGLNILDAGAITIGSKIEDNTVYICVTDGADIIVNGTPINPETALDDYTTTELNEYIEPASDSVITRYITELEIETPDFDDLAPKLLESGVRFSRMVSDYEDF